MTQSFIKSNTIGTEAEDFVIGVFEKHGYELVHRADGYYPDYDLAFYNRDGEIKTVEVKWDFKANQTGNFYLEEKALSHSKADILIYCYGQPISELYFLPLKNTFIRARHHPFNVKGGEYNDNGWLFTKRKFVEIFNPKIVEV